MHDGKPTDLDWTPAAPRADQLTGLNAAAHGLHISRFDSGSGASLGSVQQLHGRGGGQTGLQAADQAAPDSCSLLGFTQRSSQRNHHPVRRLL